MITAHPASAKTLAEGFIISARPHPCVFAFRCSDISLCVCVCVCVNVAALCRRRSIFSRRRPEHTGNIMDKVIDRRGRGVGFECSRAGHNMSTPQSFCSLPVSPHSSHSSPSLSLPLPRRASFAPCLQQESRI